VGDPVGGVNCGSKAFLKPINRNSKVTIIIPPPHNIAETNI
jgi:hypothetical protein